MFSRTDAATELMTAEQLLEYDAKGMRTELVRGRLIVREPAKYYHGFVAMRVAVRIGIFLERDQVERRAPHPLGELLAAETGFTLQRGPDTVRAPDVAFVAWARRPESRNSFAEMAPDLAVEVLSPGDRAGETLAKVADWLNAGTALVWVINPTKRNARVYRADGRQSLLNHAQSLDGEAILPGFTLPIAPLFD